MPIGEFGGAAALPGGGSPFFAAPMYWFRSSEKARRDRQEREEKIAAALGQLGGLADPARKKRPKTDKAVRRKVEEILEHFAVKPWVRVEVTWESVEQFRQIKRGRSSANTLYRRMVRQVPHIVEAFFGACFTAAAALCVSPVLCVSAGACGFATCAAVFTCAPGAVLAR